MRGLNHPPDRKVAGIPWATEAPRVGMSADAPHSSHATCHRSDGRWLSPDALGGHLANPQSLNRYAYSMNNPTSLTDPLGLDAVDYSLPVVATQCPPGMPQPYATICANATGTMNKMAAAATAANKAQCMAYEYGCGTDWTMGANYVDALGASAGAYMNYNEQGNFSVGFNIVQWYFQEGLDPTMFSSPYSKVLSEPNDQFGCANTGTCTAFFGTWVGSIGSALTGALTPSYTTYGLDFPPVPPPSPQPQRWVPQSPWDPPMPPWPLPPFPPPLPTTVALVPR